MAHFLYDVMSSNKSTLGSNMYNLRKLLSISFSVALLVCTSVAQATLITETFEVEVVSGPGTGTFGLIDVVYDDALLTGVGSEGLDNPDFDLTLDLFGQIFTNSDDIDFPGLPSLTFNDGAITFIDFIISELSGPNFTEIDDSRIGTIAGGNVVSNIDLGGIWQVSTDPAEIPEPSILLLLMLSLVIVSYSRAKQLRK
jgi:hypothetical protein